MTPGRWARSRFIRFVVAGAINTAVTYALMVALMRLVDYRVAYTVVYAFGIALAYWMQARFVFRAPLHWRTGAVFPLMYLAQYLVGVVVLWLLVRQLSVVPELAALVAILINVPIGFLLSRALLGRSSGAGSQNRLSAADLPTRQRR